MTQDRHQEWHWRSERSGPGRSGQARVVGPESFPSQGEAESWLGETYPELLAGGVAAVTLYQGDRRVYGPMSLEAESS
jgi:hypothetical protein